MSSNMARKSIMKQMKGMSFGEDRFFLSNRPELGVETLEEHSKLFDPKGKAPNKCVICDCYSRYVCDQCSWVNVKQQSNIYSVSYCSKEHAKKDKFHPLVCEEIRKLKLIPEEKVLSLEERREEIKKDLNRKHMLFAVLLKAAMKVATKKDYVTALQGGHFLVKIAVYFFGNGPANTANAEAELFKAFCSVQIGDYKTAIVCMSRVDHLFANIGDKLPITTRANICKVKGMIRLKKGSLDDALFHFSNEVYCYTEAFGTADRRTGTALSRLADVFKIRNQMDVASSMYRQVTDNWVSFLSRVILGESEDKRPVEMLDQELVVEGLEVMLVIFRFRRHVTAHTDASAEMMTALAMSMLHYLEGEQLTALKYAALVMDLTLYGGLDKVSRKLAEDVCAKISG